MKSQLSFWLRKRQLTAILLLALLVIAFEIVFYLYKNKAQPTSLVAFPTQIAAQTTHNYQPFNPNELDLEAWQQLGFTQRQAETILKYKNMVLGGKFSSKAEIARCYVISKEKFAALQPFLLLPDKAEKQTSENLGSHALKIKGQFNPDELTYHDWVQMGFSAKQAKVILNYKKFLGGSFLSKDNFRKCFVISADHYAQLAPYLLLPQQAPKKEKAQTLALTQAFNPNDLSQEEWVALGFSPDQAESILHYKKALGGQFSSKEELQRSYVISDKRFQQMLPYLLFPKDTIAEDTTPSPLHNTFDPNSLTQQEWIALGFSPAQAHTILKYKNKVLGGHFSSLEEIKKCYVISDKKFQALKPWIKIEQPKPKAVPMDNLELNTISYEQLVQFGFSKKAAGSFIGFRKILGGFMTEKQILETYYIDKALAKKLMKKATLNTQNVPRIDILTADKATLKRHPYFRYHADKIIFYRLTYKDKKKILRKMHLRKSDLQKMELYMK